jgi:NAD(P)H-hydrate epimerase
MSGAACLAGLGALRGGAGLVYVAGPEPIVPIVASVEPSYLTIPLPADDAGRLSLDALPQIQARVGEMESLAIGPGWGQSEDLRQLAAELYASVAVPMVVDADALNALSQQPQTLGRHAGPRIVTPHPGEFARLTGNSIAEVQGRREVAAREFAARHNIVLVLKGHRSVVTDGAQTVINSTGNSGMATGGTGDVLTGLIAALLAQRMSPFDAARLGAHLHGLAGDLAAAELSEPGLIASDLPRFLGAAWKRIVAGGTPRT